MLRKFYLAVIEKVSHVSGAKIKFLFTFESEKNWLFPQNFIFIFILIFILHVKIHCSTSDDTGLIIIRWGLYFDCHPEFKYFFS
jgi:hypothetical protein